MAIYSFNISNVSRATGASSCATLAYIAGIEVKDERTGKKYKYGHIDRILATKTYLPEAANEKYNDPVVLMNGIETVERNENARTAKKIIVALPRELSENERMEVLDDFVRDNITDKNYGCVVAVHDDPEHKNPHAHILIPNRRFDKNGEFETIKRKMEYALDDKGERIPVIDPTTGKQKLGARNRKQWKRISATSNPLDKKEVLEGFRRGWELSCNKFLDEIHKIDHRSYKTRNIAGVATVHEGYAARKIEKRGGVSEKCEKNRAIMRERRRLWDEQLEIQNLKKQLSILEEEHRKTTEEKAKQEAAKKAEEARKAEEERLRVEAAWRAEDERRAKEAEEERRRADDEAKAKAEAVQKAEEEAQKAEEIAAVVPKEPEPTAPKRWIPDDTMHRIAGTWFNAKHYDHDAAAMEAVISRILPGKIDFSQIAEKDQERLCEAALAVLGQIRRSARIKTEEAGKRVFSELLEAARVPERAPERQPEITPEHREPEQRQSKLEITRSKKKDQNRGYER